MRAQTHNDAVRTRPLASVVPDMPLTEECFFKTPLPFANTVQVLLLCWISIADIWCLCG